MVALFQYQQYCAIIPFPQHLTVLYPVSLTFFKTIVES
jgi:hypothetical protein